MRRIATLLLTLQNALMNATLSGQFKRNSIVARRSVILLNTRHVFRSKLATSVGYLDLILERLQTLLLRATLEFFQSFFQTSTSWLIVGILENRSSYIPSKASSLLLNSTSTNNLVPFERLRNILLQESRNSSSVQRSFTMDL